VVINVAPLLKQPLGTRVDYELQESPIDPRGDNAGLLDADIVDIDALVHATHTNPGAYFEGSADAHVAGQCARCLVPIDTPVHADFAEQYYATVPVEHGVGLVEPPLDAKTIGSDFKVDLVPLLREELILVTPVAALVAKQVTDFRREFAAVDLRAANHVNLTAYDVVTIASLVEREAEAPSERRLVASVIYNRLHAHIPLGIDATTRFEFNDWTRALTQSQLRSRSPYNTRIHRGLPPGPIGNPGLASIQAAAHPAHVDYLYYARKKDKRHHFFTASYSAFEQFLAANGYG